MVTLAFSTEQAGFILSCVGSVRNVSVRLAGAERPSSSALPRPPHQANHPAAAATAYPQPTKIQQQRSQDRNQLPRQGEQPMLHTGPDARFEICSLTGTLSPEGLHLHISLGDEAGAVWGGHLVRATVHTTAEIVIGVALSLTFSREMDPATGFKELVVSRPSVRMYWIILVLYAFVIVVVFSLLASNA
ncbi:unnamed protein product [Hapterophycus canaliculatus]